MKTRQLVPLIFLPDVERSIGFYKHFGFAVGNTFAAATRRAASLGLQTQTVTFL